MSEERESLLRKWASIAPKECAIRECSPGLSGPPASVQVHPFEGWFQYGHKVASAMILAALIESIRARGLHWAITSDEAEPENEGRCAWYHAEVHDYDSERGWYAEKAEPYYALLAAYIAAIEST